MAYHNWGDDLTPEDREKIREFKAEQYQKKNPKPERLLAEFGRYFGFDGVRAVLHNEISAQLFVDLLSEASSAERERQAQLLSDINLGVAAAMDEKASSSMRKSIKQRTR